MKNALRGFKIMPHFKPLLVPKYKDSLLKDKNYEISKVDYKNLMAYIDSYDENVLLLSQDLKSRDFGYSTLCKIRHKHKNPNDNTYINIRGKNEKLESQEALQVIDEFFHSSHKEFKEFAELSDEISHFNHFSGTLEPQIIDEINKKIEELVVSGVAKSEEELKAELQQGKINIDEYTEGIKQSVEEHKTSCYKYEIDVELKEHYYNPLMIDNKDDGQITYAVKNKCEKDFLEDLKKYLRNSNNALKEL